MSSYSSQREDAVFQAVVPQLEAEGFSVFLHPSASMLPAFLQGYRPDAIAYKGDRKMAIEITARTQNDGSKLKRLREALQAHPEWELQVFYAPPLRNEDAIPASSRETIEEHLQRIEGSLEAMGTTAALLLAWATFEAAARRLVPDGFAQPQSPSRLIEVLASQGYVTPDEADTLRGLIQIRNAAAHGRLDLTTTRSQVEDLVGVTRTILALEP
ncbi:hypothetical protein [Acidisphaera sp. L21]|uniref:hypothetical protein n=1 Tax=Acidisphaera sp. L21 TaxID=1641851 RepID=UPI0020B147A7|nr:hypothetical protein [Acidisphaera sp. L21]